MRKINLAIILFILLAGSLNLSAAPLHFEPVSKQLPDGRIINLYVSGDEFFNYLHDLNEFPVGVGSDGFYYYLIQEGDNFIQSAVRFPDSDPGKIKGVKKISIPSFVAEKRNSFYRKTEEESIRKGVKSYSKTSGVFNNLVIYIRFLNEAAFSVQRSVYETRLNSLATSSMRFYYKEISYGKLDVVSYSFPGGSTSNIYYTDTHPRTYFQPYNSLTNTNGYSTDAEKASREHALLANAINWATSNYTLPSGVNFDVNNDGIVDNICFIVKGTSDGWNDLLWPHRWVLYSQSVYLSTLKVYGYTLQLENVSVNTLCHEMFHAIGAPDLYHYNNTENPVGPWDIMANGACHPGAWMKYQYGGWISKITEIKESGTYTIKPLIQESNNCYILRSPYREDQFFAIEFRKRTGNYETNLPASGLIIQRIDTRYKGNANGPPDEIYVFRNNGSLKVGGEINSACFSDLYNRTSFSDSTNPFSFFQEGGITGISITNIKSMGDSMSFTVGMEQPVEFVLTAQEDNQISGSFKSLSSKEFLVAVSPTSENLIPEPNHNYIVGDHIGKGGIIIQKSKLKSFLSTNLISDEKYFFTVWTILNNSPQIYSLPVSTNIRTGIYAFSTLPYIQNFDEMDSELPRGWKSSSGINGWQLFKQAPFSSPSAILLQNESPGQEGWFYTPGFSLLSSNKYMISFRYKNKSLNAGESLSLLGGPDRYNNGMNRYSLFSSINFNYRNYAVYKAVLKPALNGTCYFGFKTGITSQGILIDDFRIEKVPSKTTEHFNPIEFYPNPTNGIITVPATGETKISVYSMDGIVKYETTIESMQIIDLSHIGKGVFHIRFTNGDKTDIGKIVIL